MHNSLNKDISHADLISLLTYDAETGIFRRKKGFCGKKFKTGSIVGTLTKEGYLAIRLNGRGYSAHRIAWFYITKSWPIYDIDHMDGDRKNNRFNNLRDVPRSINLQNRRGPQPNNKAGFLGVATHHGKYRAQIYINGKVTIIGRFDTPEDAYEAYIKAKRNLHIGCTI